jgi:hypothetical protein
MQDSNSSTFDKSFPNTTTLEDLEMDGSKAVADSTEKLPGLAERLQGEAAVEQDAEKQEDTGREELPPFCIG